MGTETYRHISIIQPCNILATQHEQKTEKVDQLLAHARPLLAVIRSHRTPERKDPNTMLALVVDQGSLTKGGITITTAQTGRHGKVKELTHFTNKSFGEYF